MAAAKAVPAVEVRKNDAGDYELGIVIDGAWVAFAHKGAGYVEQLVTKVREGNAPAG